MLLSSVQENMVKIVLFWSTTYVKGGKNKDIQRTLCDKNKLFESKNTSFYLTMTLFNKIITVSKFYVFSVISNPANFDILKDYASKF